MTLSIAIHCTCCGDNGVTLLFCTASQFIRFQTPQLVKNNLLFFNDILVSSIVLKTEAVVEWHEPQIEHR